MSKNLVAEWNKKCGTIVEEGVHSSKYFETLKNQVKRVQEELNEVSDELNLEGFVSSKLLKELADLKVVTDGLFYLSDLPVQTAYEMVMADNDRKWTTDFGEIVEIFEDKYSPETHEIVQSTHEGVVYYSIHRKSDYKICKLEVHGKMDFSEIL